ncbi:GNAT family N-acetyltransferase [Sphingomonas sp. MMS24-JH45]
MLTVRTSRTRGGERAEPLLARHRLSLLGGGTREARALRANDRMYVALMAHARARGCTRFDFGRSKAGTGAAAFKKNWGFVPTPRSRQLERGSGARGQSARPQIRADGADVAAIASAGRQSARLWISRGLG